MSEEVKNNKNYNAFFRQFLFIAALVVIGLVIWGQLGFFVSCFLGSITLYIVFRKPLIYLTEKKGWKPWKASLCLIISIAILLLGVGFLVYEVIASEVSTITINVDAVSNSISQLIEKVSIYFNHPLFPKDIIGKAEGLISGLVSNLLNTTYNFVFNALMMIIVLYFMFANSKKMESKLIEYSPLKGESLEMIKHEANNMILGNAVGIPVIMIVQGLFSALGYWLLGINNVLFWGFLTAVFGLLPVIGTTGIWLPLSIYLIANGSVWQGVVLIIYGVLIISNADNACRLVLMKKMANTHPLIVIFGVILGIPLFGFWGIIFGPLLISGFLLLLKIYSIEYGKKNETKIE